MLLFVTIISLVGSRAFSRASGILFVVLMLSSLSIPLSSLFVRPFSESILPGGNIEYTGISFESLKGNLWPKFTTGAAGSGNPLRKETVASVFGVFFPATAGIFAGASMSGDLKNPSVSIPRGTLYGMGLTFFIYLAVIFALATTVTRTTFYTDINVLQDVYSFHTSLTIDQSVPILYFNGNLLFGFLLGSSWHRWMRKVIASHC
jgi:potassium/chloride transporter 9